MKSSMMKKLRKKRRRKKTQWRSDYRYVTMYPRKKVKRKV